jgi:threonine aldolase
MLLGTREFIDEARIWRKRLGGGMRQVGILAAAGLIALDDGPKRLHEDHENANILAEGLANVRGIDLDPAKVVTNIVIFDVSKTGKAQAEIVEQLAQNGVLAVGFDSKIRMVTHLDVSAGDIRTAINLVAKAV